MSGRIAGDDVVRRRWGNIAERSRRVTIRIDADTDEELEQLTRVLHVFKSAVLRLAIHEGLTVLEQRHRQALDDLVAGAMSDKTRPRQCQTLDPDP